MQLSINKWSSTQFVCYVLYTVTLSIRGRKVLGQPSNYLKKKTLSAVPRKVQVILEMAKKKPISNFFFPLLKDIHE